MRLQPVGAIKSAPIQSRNLKAKGNNALQETKTNNVNFTGNPNHVIFYVAEFPDYNKKGGVANVGGYYEKMPGIEAAIVQSYYNGQKDYNNKGEYTGLIQPWQFDANCRYEGLKNQYFYVKFDTDKKNIKTETTTNLANNIEKKNIVILKKIAEKNVTYGKQQPEDIILFKVMNAVPVKNEKGEITDYKLEELPNDPVTGKTRNHFLIYSKGTAEFKVPYDDGSYSSDKTKNPEAFSKYKPMPYPENNRAFTEFKKEICDAVITTDKSKFDPKTIHCSDPQTVYTASFMREAAINGNPEFQPQDVSPAYTIHNLRMGYTGECGGLDMALNLGLTSDEVDIMRKDPEFIKAEENGTLDKYFAEYMPELKDFFGSFNPTLIAFNLRKNGYMTGLNTVSDGYAKDVANNPNIPTALQGDWKTLMDQEKAIGIMNPFEDPGFHIFKGVTGMDGYLKAGVNKAKEQLSKLGGEYAALAEEIHPFAVVDESKFPKEENGNYKVTEEAYDHYIDIKNINKKEFLNRLTSKFDKLKDADKDLYNTLIAGRANWNVNLIGRIDENLLTPEKIKDLKVYVSWGRLDSQKSPDIVMDAFDKYCTEHPEDAKNCILILGGEAPGTEYSDKILAKAEIMASKYNGHFSFMESFAPGKILVSVAEMALLPSREAPCELTDLETMQFMTLLTATNAQGMADKNFDPAIDGEDKATSFKTESGYYISTSQIENCKQAGIGEQWKKEYGKLMADIANEQANRKASAFKTDLDSNETLENYINANPKHKKAVDELIDKYRSLILAAGVAVCMERGVSLTKAQRMKMAENELNLKTGWTNNEVLTKRGKASADLYKAIFASKPEQDTGKYSTSFLGKLREHLQAVKNDIEIRQNAGSTPSIKPSFWGKYRKVITWSATSAAIVGGGVYLFMANKNNDSGNKHGMHIKKHPGKPRPRKINMNA